MYAQTRAESVRYYIYGLQTETPSHHIKGMSSQLGTCQQVVRSGPGKNQRVRYARFLHRLRVNITLCTPRHGRLHYPNGNLTRYTCTDLECIRDQKSLH